MSSLSCDRSLAHLTLNSGAPIAAAVDSSKSSRSRSIHELIGSNEARVTLRDWHPTYHHLAGAEKLYLNRDMPDFDDLNGDAIPLTELSLHYREQAWVFAECRPQM